MTSSVISFSKREIHEEIPGMQNAIYRIEPCVSFAEPSILYIEDSFHYKPDIDGNQDRVLVQSAEIAKSIAHMHTTSQIISKPGQCPAVFAIENEKITADELFKKYKPLVDQHLRNQRTWYEALVRLADDDWQQVRKHRMISDIQRTAARELSLEREWLSAVLDEEKNACPFCGTDLLSVDAPICPNCGKVHNPIKLAELEASINKVIAKPMAVK